MSKPKLLTVPEVAEQYHASTKTIWRRLRDGKLPRVKVGRCTRIPAEAVDAYIARGGEV